MTWTLYNLMCGRRSGRLFPVFHNYSIFYFFASFFNTRGQNKFFLQIIFMFFFTLVHCSGLTGRTDAFNVATRRPAVFGSPDGAPRG